jgi:ABC-type nitrate/sulfonate/bicarbonate transport system substrate-binding protein
LKSGRVDAMTGDELTNFALKSSTEYHALVDFNQWKVPMASNGVNVDRAWLREPRNRELTRRFIKSMVEAIAIMKQNREAAYRAMAEYYGITDPQMQAHFYEPIHDVPRKPYPTLDGIKKTMELFDGPDMRQHKPEDFFDDSFVRELDQSGYIDSLYSQSR